jgi:DNA invertase Pin-like site-specific DNA recombinase
MKPNIIYIRTSTEEQNPENQLADCKALAEKLSITDYEILKEEESAYSQDTEREKFDLIFKAISKGQIKNFIIWDLDRIYRNRKKLIAFFEICNHNKCRVYSFRQGFLEDINRMPEPFNDIMQAIMLQFMGWLAEDESKKKSARVKIAVRHDSKTGETQSYKGNKWGRPTIPERVIEDVRKARAEGKSYGQIAKEVSYYDKNNNKKNISKTLVHKILAGEYSQTS